jgi:hypothetical protein
MSAVQPALAFAARSPDEAGVPVSLLAPWPAADVPTAAEADRAIEAVLRGAPGGLDAELVARVSRELSEAERAAFAGEAEGAASVLRAGAGMRWRLGAAVVTAPQSGAFDADAVAALLADTDDLLAGLKKLADESPDAAAPVAAIRAGVVHDAISIGNVVQRLTPAGAAKSPAAVKALQARVLSITAGEAPSAGRRRARVLWAALAVAALGAGGLELQQRLSAPPPPATAAGAPAGSMVSGERSGRSLLVTRDGKPMPAEDLARLREAQRSRGRAVREVAAGVYELEPIGAGEVKP